MRSPTGPAIRSSPVSPILAGVYAVRFGLTVNDLATTWVPYLTMSEALRLVAQSFTTPVDQLSCCSA